ncbi:MAG TPA: hemerythrin domain-containing protein [Nitrospiria bacterium]|jgi:hemerythrin-like domain-containing protein
MGVFVDQLKIEHENIRLIGDIAKKVCQRINQGEEVLSEDIDHIIEFLDIYSYKGHHEKEEKGLLPAIEKAGGFKDGKTIGAIIQDHATLKIYIEKMKENHFKYKEKKHPGLSGLVGYTLNYLDFLYRHLEKEEKVFYKLADQLLSEEDQEGLLKRFESQDFEKIGKEKLDEFQKRLSQLSEQYLKAG